MSIFVNELMQIFCFFGYLYSSKYVFQEIPQ